MDRVAATQDAATTACADRILRLLRGSSEPLKCCEIAHQLGFDLVSTAARVTRLRLSGHIVRSGVRPPYRYSVVEPVAGGVAALELGEGRALSGWGFVPPTRVLTPQEQNARADAPPTLAAIIHTVLSVPHLAFGIQTGDIKRRFGVQQPTATLAKRLLRQIAAHG